MHACIHPRDVERYMARPASTTFRVLDKQGQWALVEAKASAALRHQIRVHLAATGHALANDRLYGGTGVSDIDGHALHASRVVWAGDEVVPPFDVSSPMPQKWTATFGFRES
jgi:23S rRNA pseudouridine1911/1915/1917 synthase